MFERVSRRGEVSSSEEDSGEFDRSFAARLRDN